MSDKEQPRQKETKKEKTFHIPLRPIPNEADLIAKEMQEIFDEDKIVHRHGSSEPEGD